MLLLMDCMEMTEPCLILLSCNDFFFKIVRVNVLSLARNQKKFY